MTGFNAAPGYNLAAGWGTIDAGGILPPFGQEHRILGRAAEALAASTTAASSASRSARPAGARVVRLGQTTFYQRARRKLRITDSAEIPLPLTGSGLDV